MAHAGMQYLYQRLADMSAALHTATSGGQHEEAPGVCTALQCSARAGHKCRIPLCPVSGEHSCEEIPIPGDFKGSQGVTLTYSS